MDDKITLYKNKQADIIDLYNNIDLKLQLYLNELKQIKTDISSRLLFKAINITVESIIIKFTSNRNKYLNNDDDFLAYFLANDIILNAINDNIVKINKILYNYKNSITKDDNERKINFKIFCERTYSIVLDIDDKFRVLFSWYTKLKSNTGTFNSDDFYKKKLEELKNKKRELEKEIGNMKKPDENRAELELVDIQIKDIEKLKLNKEEQEDAIQLWKDKITDAFNSLKYYIKPITNEHERLQKVFDKNNTYKIITLALLVIYIIAIFCYFVYNILCLKERLNIDYMIYFSLIPILGALLWLFTYQKNKSQRHMISLAKYMHEIEYVEGILLTINSLSTDMKDSTERINRAIDKLLENHLGKNLSSEKYSEENLLKEEKKDIGTIDSLIKLLKELKGLKPMSE